MEYNDSECSSGCESGWTLYLDDNSFVSAFNNNKIGFLGKGKCGFDDEQRTEEDEEDMSMVSDASSGPPHIPEEQNYYANGYTKCFRHEPTDTARLKAKTRAKKLDLRKNKRRNLHEKSSLLDDTASSPVFNLHNNQFRLSNNHHDSADALLDISKDYSTTQFEGSSAYHQSQYGFYQYSSLSGTYLQENQGDLEAERSSSNHAITFSQQFALQIESDDAADVTVGGE